MHIDAQFRRIQHLMKPDIDSARHTRQAALDFFRNFVVGLLVAADELNVDRRRDPEIEDLADHVRRPEEEAHAGERRGQLPKVGSRGRTDPSAGAFLLRIHLDLGKRPCLNLLPKLLQQLLHLLLVGE